MNKISLESKLYYFKIAFCICRRAVQCALAGLQTKHQYQTYFVTMATRMSN